MERRRTWAAKWARRRYNLRMERRAFFAAIASPIIANGFPGPDADLKELHKRYLRAWREGSDREADALTFQLREPGPTPN